MLNDERGTMNDEQKRSMMNEIGAMNDAFVHRSSFIVHRSNL
jgi:hypothetical protein